MINPNCEGLGGGGGNQAAAKSKAGDVGSKAERISLPHLDKTTVHKKTVKFKGG